jgi:hypothetical protein
MSRYSVLVTLHVLSVIVSARCQHHPRASSRASPTATSSRIAGSGTPVRLW